MRTISFITSMLLASLSFAADADKLAEVRANIGFIDQQYGILEITESPMPGLYEVIMKGSGVVYVNAEGTILIDGQMLAVSAAGMTSITQKAEARQNELMSSVRKDELAKVKVEDSIVFKAEGETKTIAYIFTDTDCGYCRKLHAEIEELNELGVEVHYLAWPRAGMGSQTAKNMESAWCADDPQKALTKLKQGKGIETATCENAMEEQLALGRKLGVSGTPAIFGEDGRFIAGYMPAARLFDALTK